MIQAVTTWYIVLQIHTHMHTIYHQLSRWTWLSGLPSFYLLHLFWRTINSVQTLKGTQSIDSNATTDYRTVCLLILDIQTKNTNQW